MALTNDFFSQWLASWTGNNPEALLAFYHDEIFYSDPAHKNGLQGKTALKNYLIKLFARNPAWKWELVHLDQVSSPKFYLKWRASIPTTNTLVTEVGLDLIELKDGKIIRNEVYFDTRYL